MTLTGPDALERLIAIKPPEDTLHLELPAAPDFQTFLAVSRDQSSMIVIRQDYVAKWPEMGNLTLVQAERDGLITEGVDHATAKRLLRFLDVDENFMLPGEGGGSETATMTEENLGGPKDLVVEMTEGGLFTFRSTDLRDARKAERAGWAQVHEKAFGRFPTLIDDFKIV
jgi:hypothetical protein